MKKKIVKVTWVDSSEYYGWQDVTEVQEKQCMRVMTVGILWEKTQAHLKIVQSFGESTHILGILVIPRGCVKSIEELGEVEVPDGSSPD